MYNKEFSWVQIFLGESEEKGKMKKSFSCIAVVIRIYKYPW